MTTLPIRIAPAKRHAAIAEKPVPLRPRPNIQAGTRNMMNSPTSTAVGGWAPIARSKNTPASQPWNQRPAPAESNRATAPKPIAVTTKPDAKCSASAPRLYKFDSA